LGRIGSPPAVDALKKVVAIEADLSVRQEIHDALEPFATKSR
jgi:hypothetical protein